MRSKNVMTILKENYLIRKHKDNIYNVYDKVEIGKCANFNKYLCSVREESKNVFEFELHPLFTELYGNNNIVLDNSNVVKSINNYLTTLEFNSEYFDPSWRYGYAEDRVLCDALKSLGLKDERSGLKNCFVFKEYKIEIDLFNELGSKYGRDNSINMWIGGTIGWHTINTNGTVVDTIKQVKNLLFPHITIDTILFTNLFNRLELSDVNDSTYNVVDEQSLTIDSKNNLEDNILKLEKALEQLKSKRK